MMEEHISPMAITHLLQHTLRSLCIHDNSQWVYAVFWRILPRNYPPPKWDIHGGAYDRSRGNRRNWILVWEDGFCNFASSAAAAAAVPELISSGDCPTTYGHNNCEFQHFQGLQPELFFKMSHEIYNYGEGLIGKVAADHSHRWVHKEPNDQSEINFLSAWHNSADLHPRTWEAQFQSGIKTICLIAVREGVVQLGAVSKVLRSSPLHPLIHSYMQRNTINSRNKFVLTYLHDFLFTKVAEDLNYVVSLRKKFSYIESIPGVLLPHPSSSAFPAYTTPESTAAAWHFQQAQPDQDYYTDHNHQHFTNNNIANYNNSHMKITPSMSSLEALLSKLPPVIPPPPSFHSSSSPQLIHSQQFMSTRPPTFSMEKIMLKEEMSEDDHVDYEGSAATYGHHQQHPHYYQH